MKKLANPLYRQAVPFLWLLLVPLGVLTFHNLSDADFVGDDFPQIVHNESIRSLDHPIDFLTGSTFNSGGGNEMQGIYYRPVMVATFALIYRFWDYSAFHFHIILIGITIINSILAFFFLRSLFTPLISFIGAAAFLLHPLNSEVTQYISNYQDALFMMFGLIALNIEVYRKSDNIAWFAGEFALLTLSVLSKETGLLFLPILVLFNILVRRHRQPMLSNISIYRTVAAVAVTYSLVRIFVFHVNVVQSQHAPMELASLAVRLLNMPAIVFYYLKNFLFPWPLGVSQHWIYRDITVEGFFLPLLGFAAFLTFGVLTVRRFGSKAMFFLAWWLIAIGLHVHLIPLDSTVADRWHYMPSLGLIGLVLLWIEDSLPRASIKHWTVAATLLLIFGFGIRTHIRNEDWANDERLLSRDLLYQPESFAIMSQLGSIYLDQKRYTEACPLLEKSVALAPRWAVNTNNLGACYYHMMKWDEAEAQFRKSIENGRYYLAYENLAKMLVEQKRYAEAREFLKKALGVFPDNRVLSRLLATAKNE